MEEKSIDKKSEGDGSTSENDTLSLGEASQGKYKNKII